MRLTRSVVGGARCSVLGVRCRISRSTGRRLETCEEGFV